MSAGTGNGDTQHRGPKLCNEPGKRRYRDRVAAELAALSVATRGKVRKGRDEEQEPYPCANHWHLRNVAKRRVT